MKAFIASLWVPKPIMQVSKILGSKMCASFFYCFSRFSQFQSFQTKKTCANGFSWKAGCFSISNLDSIGFFFVSSSFLRVRMEKSLTNKKLEPEEMSLEYNPRKVFELFLHHFVRTTYSKSLMLCKKVYN